MISMRSRVNKSIDVNLKELLYRAYPRFILSAGGCRGSGYPVLIVRGGSVPRLIANITFTPLSKAIYVPKTNADATWKKRLSSN